MKEREKRGRKGKRGEEWMEGRRRWRSCVKGHVVALLVILINEDLDAERACSQRAAAGTCSPFLMSSPTPCFSHASRVYFILSFICQWLCIKMLSSVGNKLWEHSVNNLSGEERSVETLSFGSLFSSHLQTAAQYAEWWRKPPPPPAAAGAH